MKQLIISLLLAIMCIGCVAFTEDKTELASSSESETNTEQSLTPEQKLAEKKAKEEQAKIHQIKCQDAKMDQLEAETNKDAVAISRAYKRILQYCKTQ